MALTDYDTMKAEVLAWCGRSDSTFSARFDVFVALTEDRMYFGSGRDTRDPLYCEPIRSQAMETTGTITMTSGTGSMPTTAIGIRRIHRAGDETGLTYKPPAAFSLLDENSSGGDPIYYTVEGASLKVTPTYTGSITALYWQRFTAITSSNKTGSMLTEHPLAYFNGCMHEAFAFMQEADAAMAWLARYRTASTFSGVTRSAPGTAAGSWL